jgi:hypothetical protein
MSDKPIHEQIADNLYGSTDPFGNRIEPGPPFIQSEGAYGHAEPRRDKPRTAAGRALLKEWHDNGGHVLNRMPRFGGSFADRIIAIEAEAAGRHDPEAVRLDVERLAKAIEQSYPTTPNVEVDSDHEWYLMRAEGIAAEYERLARTATDGSGDE